VSFLSDFIFILQPELEFLSLVLELMVQALEPELVLVQMLLEQVSQQEPLLPEPQLSYVLLLLLYHLFVLNHDAIFSQQVDPQVQPHTS